MKTQTMNAEKFAIAFGERAGLDVRPNQIKLEGNWLFYRSPEWPHEIDAYRLPLPMIAEPYDEVKYDESPVKPNNHIVVAMTIKKLNRSYDS